MMSAALHFVARKLCPESYFVHLVLAEKRLSFSIEFLEPHDFPKECYAFSPYKTLPILASEDEYWTGWQAIIGYCCDQEPVPSKGATVHALMPKTSCERGLVRYYLQLYGDDFARDVTRPLFHEKVGRRYLDKSEPSANMILSARHNLTKSYLPYLERLFHDRSYIVGDDLSLADLMLAAQICCLDYLGELPWRDFPELMVWYQRMKSRHSFSPLLKQKLRKQFPSKNFATLDEFS